MAIDFKKFLLTLKSPQGLVVLFFAVLFTYTAPYSIQSGDTSELVTNSYFLRVSHPPGYPLWTLLYHLPIRYLPFINPFHIASLFTSFISVMWIGTLLFHFRNKQSLSLILVLATSLIFWRYSIMPDVFALHMFFLVMVFLVFNNPKLLNRKWMIFLVSLSVANHHTIVFAFPLYLYALLQGEIKKKILFSLLFGFFSGSFYLLLLCFHPEDYGSWGNIQTFQDVIHHFLRKDYGTFSLQTGHETDQTSWIYFFLKSLILNSWSMLLGLGFLFVKYAKQLKAYWVQIAVLLFSFSIYLITFYFGGVMSLDGLGETVFERFLMQPTLILFFLLLFLMSLPEITVPKWLLISFLVNAGLNLSENLKHNNYRHNTMIEDYALNIFNSLPEKSIYFSHGDTQGSGAYYLHDVMKVRPDVVHFHPSLYFNWSMQKLHNLRPDAFPDPHTKIIEAINYKDYRFFMNIPPGKLPENFGVRYHGIVFEVFKSLESKPGIIYECEAISKYSWRNRTTLEDLQSFEISHVYDLEYGRCDYALGWELYLKKDTPKAVFHLEKAMEVSPLSSKFLERLCFVYKEIGDEKWKACEEKLAEYISQSNQQYYLYKYEK